MNPIIFLDIDGVLNPRDYAIVLSMMSKRRNNIYLSIDKNHKCLFDERCVKYFNEIIIETKADIVISSVWRGYGIKLLRKLWKERKIKGRIIGLTRSTKSGPPKDIRGIQIQEYIDEFKIEKYCIIDDDRDMLSSQYPYFVHVNGDYGLNYFAYEKVKNILLGKNKFNDLDFYYIKDDKTLNKFTWFYIKNIILYKIDRHYSISKYHYLPKIKEKLCEFGQYILGI